MGVLLFRTQYGSAEPEVLVTPVQGEALMLEELIRQEQHILFDAIVNGDPSLFPSIYYNDPSIDLHSDYELSIDLYGDEARATLATLENGPKGGDRGYLTARIASLIYGERNIAAWESVLAATEAEGREPSIDDLPEGYVPMERVAADQWIEPDYHIHDVKVGGEHATAKVAFGPPEAGGQILSYQFARVDGRWYVSYMEATWSQGDPDYQGEGVP